MGWYQLPHLSVGVIEMAFTISTGHPDYIAIGIEDYGDSSCGSGWTVWIGKKDQGSSHYDAQTSKHMILNNQMKGYGEGCMDFGFYYSAQMMSIEIPDFDWATTALASPTADSSVTVSLLCATRSHDV